MTGAEFLVLLDAGLIPEKLEFIDGRILGNGTFEFCFDWPHALAARQAGVTVRSCVDAVLESEEATAELLHRLVVGYFASARGGEDAPGGGAQSGVSG
jgi:hypothetical protein